MIAGEEILRSALKSLRRNKSSSMLTTLGIAIGVGAVIAAFAIGQGANKMIDEQIAAFGSNFIMVFSQRSGSSSQGNIHYITVDDANAIEKNVSGVDALAPLVNAQVTVVYGNTNWTTSLIGSNANYTYVQSRVIAKGRDIVDSDVHQGTKVAVIGQTVAEKLFREESPLRKNIRINKIPFRIVGVYEQKGQSYIGGDQDDIILIPITTAQKRIIRKRGSVDRIQSIYIQGVSMEALDYIQSETEALLRELHKIGKGEPDDFSVRNISQMLEARKKTTSIMSLLLAAIACISLVVGGIGIMNIMLVSVTERTKEIGVRMAVGAKMGDIRTQFLLEAVVLSNIGGFIGILCGIATGFGFATITQAPPIFSIPSILLAFIFSGVVGVGFGYYPAYKASLLNPIDALKYE